MQVRGLRGGRLDHVQCAWLAAVVGVTVVFEAPTKHNAVSRGERAGAHRVICKAFFNGRGTPAPDQREQPMSDNDLVLRVPHSLGAVEAKRRIASGVAAVKTQYGSYFRTSEAEWDGNRLTFCLTALAQTVRGTVDVEDDHVELRAQLPTVIRLLAKRFVPAVRDAGQKQLTKNP